MKFRRLSEEEARNIQNLETLYRFMHVGGSCTTEEDGKTTYYIGIESRGNANYGRQLIEKFKEVLGAERVEINVMS